MIRKIAAAVIALGLIGTSVAEAKAPCRDSKGKFTKCEAPAAPTKCRDAKGRFAKCDAAKTPDAAAAPTATPAAPAKPN